MNKVSYALGLSIGKNFLTSGFEVENYEDFLSGLKAAMQEDTPAISFEEAKGVIDKYFKEIQVKELQQNKELGEEFLKINSLKKGVITLDNGLQYEVIRQGTGDKPKLEDTVKCHYHGTLINGTVFDSSMDRGEPIGFPLQGVIKGWTEILQLMPVGSKWKVTIPSELAYGERGAGQHIRPNSVLIFIIELLDIVKK